tara:strand:+ start:2366 stop:2854 length:489 start_codon:yes stop_codon:yes gene_type:complete
MSPKGIRIKKTGIYNIKDLCKSIQDYFNDRKYGYQLKDSQSKGNAKGHDVSIKYQAIKKIDNYVRFHIDMELFILSMEKVKIKTKLLDKGKMDINFKAYLFLDYKNKWNTNIFARFLNWIYNNFMIRKKIKKHYSSNLYIELINLQDIVKKKLDLYLHEYGS